MNTYRNILLLIIIFSSSFVWGDENMTVTLQPLNNHDTIITHQFYDGLGRPQSSAISSNGTFTPVFSAQEYNLKGLPYKQWLPVPVNTSPTSLSAHDIIDEAIAYYDDGHYACSKTVYDNSPLNLTVAQYGPGTKWQTNDKGVKTERFANSTTTEELKCINFAISDDGLSFERNGFVDNGMLDVVKTTDEDGHSLLVFTDFLGRTILERRLLAERFIDTYYIYDKLSNLRFVLSPMATNQLKNATGTIDANNEYIKKYGYAYDYDGYNRCTSKQLPGRDPITFVYDDYGRLAFCQDGNQRQDGQWTYYSYDFVGRMVEEGLTDNLTENRARSYARAVCRSLPADSASCAMYRSQGNLRNRTKLVENYFDNYVFLSNFAGDNQQLAYRAMADYDTCTMRHNLQNSRLVGRATAVLSGSGEIGSLMPVAFYYNAAGNVVQSHEKNILGGYNHTYYRYSITEKPLQVRYEHTTADSAFVDVYYYTYDCMDRVTSVCLSHDGAQQVILCQYAYDELGRLVDISEYCGGRQTA